MKFEFTRDLETGNAMIDKEHRELFDAVNQLMDACSQGQGRIAVEPAAKFLLDYVKKHFAHEEQLQVRNGFPEYKAHKAFHEDYKQKLQEIVDAIPEAGPTVATVATLNKHLSVLIQHIKMDDKKLAEFLKQ